MTQFISTKKCVTHYAQIIIQGNKLHRTCHLHQKKMVSDTKFSFLRRESDLVLLIQCATQYLQRTETQNSKHWRNGFSNLGTVVSILGGDSQNQR